MNKQGPAATADEHTSFFDFGFVPAISQPPTQRPKSNRTKKQAIAAFFHFEKPERLEDIAEEHDDGRSTSPFPSPFGSSVPSPFASPSSASLPKRTKRVWNVNSSSSLPKREPEAKTIPFELHGCITSTEDDTNNRYSFPIPPTSVPIRRSLEGLSLAKDTNNSFAYELPPISPVSSIASGSCFSPLFSATSERFTPMTPAFPPPKAYSKPLPSTPFVLPDDDVLAHHQACPSPDLDPELSAQSSASSINSEELQGSIVSYYPEEEPDEFKIIPRLFGSWSFDPGFGMDADSHTAGFAPLPERNWEQAIDELFSVARSRRPSAQSEFACIGEMAKPLEPVPNIDEELLKRLAEAQWLLPRGTAPSPHDSVTITPAEEEEVKPIKTTAPLILKGQKTRPAPLVTANPANILPWVILSPQDQERPPPSQSIPSAPFSPVNSVNLDSWPTWNDYTPPTDRRPSVSAMRLMSRFSDSEDGRGQRNTLKRRGGTPNSRTRTVSSTLPAQPASAPPTQTSSSPAWFKRKARGTESLGSSYTTLNAIAAAPSEPRTSTDSARSTSSQASVASANKPPRSVLKRSGAITRD